MKLLGNRLFSWRHEELSLELQIPVHDRRHSLDRQPKHVFNARWSDRHIERDVVTTLRNTNDVARGEDVGMKQLRVDRAQVSIAIRPIHNRMKFSMQRHGMVAGIDAEIWSIGFPVHNNIV